MSGFSWTDLLPDVAAVSRAWEHVANVTSTIPDVKEAVPPADERQDHGCILSLKNINTFKLLGV